MSGKTIFALALVWGFAGAIGGIAFTRVTEGYPPSVTGPIPKDANACLKAGFKLVIDFKANRISCEEP